MPANQSLTISDLAELEDVHYMTAYKWVQNGIFGDPDKLPRSSGKHYLIPREVYQGWVAKGRPKNGKNHHRR